MRAILTVLMFVSLNPVTQIATMWIWLPTFWWGDALAGFVPFWMPARFISYWGFGV